MRPLLACPLIFGVLMAAVAVGGDQSNGHTWAHTLWITLALTPIGVVLGLAVGAIREVPHRSWE